MIRPTEEDEFRAEEWPDDDTAREYAELVELEELGATPAGAEPWRVAEAAEALAGAGELDLLAELEESSDWSLRLAEAETTEDRIGRRLEGMETDEADLRREADPGALPDDEIDRAAEGPSP